jgi:hypothetical protein
MDQVRSFVAEARHTRPWVHEAVGNTSAEVVEVEVDILCGCREASHSGTATPWFSIDYEHNGSQEDEGYS